ncbi:MAG TPA: guanine deaminase [Holophagaceae bacterium]|nr:guanine deaminase [Holophagaceae bacterium]
MLIRAALLDAPERGRLRFVEDGALLLEGARIVDAGKAEDLLPRHAGVEVHDLRPLWVLPGLVDLHTHLPQLEAVAQDGLTLLEWLDTHIFPTEARFADAAHARRVARACFKGCLREGTTTVVAYGSSHPEAADVAFQEAEAAGLRAVLGPALMDRNAPEALLRPADRALADLDALGRAWHGRHGRLELAVAPRFAPSCTPTLMRGAAALAERFGAVIETHLAETPAEIAWVEDLFPEAPHYTGVYEAMGLLGPRTLLGHGIHLGPEERELIKAAGASVVHCPRSNAFLQSGIMPLRRWLEEGLSVGLGTDVGAGPSLSLFEEMGFACQVAKLRSEPIDGATALHLATVGGARALGWEDRLGTLDAGKEADFILVDPALADPLGREGGEAGTVLAHLLYRARPGLVRGAFVQGARCL